MEDPDEVLRSRIIELADDATGGRAPASPGEELTLEILEREYRGLGLEGTAPGSYRQAVPLVSIRADAVSELRVTGGATALSFEYGDDMMVWTKRMRERAAIDASDIVFAGYGIVAPEYSWNDYANIDVRGKTVVVLVNDPGFATSDPAVFNGRAMTYYGRWTYKYEEAARQGASGVFIVHETDAAGYPWEVVSGSWSGEQFDLVAENGNSHRAAIEGWLTRDAAMRLFAAAGREFDSELARAARPGFRASSMGLLASVSVDNTLRESTSNNVVGFIRGADRPNEVIVYSAHWDHLGNEGDGEDTIYNGAKDNAAGIAMMLGIADAFAAGPTPARSVLFLATTAEESGLLGSAWYARNPLFPLETTVANINIDSPTLHGPTADITVIGSGSSELEVLLAEEAARQDRVLAAEPTPEKGMFYRSDHFNFSKRGVPVLYAKGGVDNREHGRDFGLEWEADYTANRYHKVTDEYDPAWDTRGALEDMELLYRVGARLANSGDWPNWYEGNEFRRVRDDSAAARSQGDASGMP